MINISAVVLTKNEEKNIVDCLESVKWCDEMIIIDDESEDRTIEKVQSNSSKLKIYKRYLNGDFSAQRNFGLSKAKSDWVLFVDADERVTKDLRDEILISISSQDLHLQKLRGFYIKRRDFMWGRELKHGEVGNIKLLRLAKRDSGKWEGKVHEEWKVQGKIGKLENPILHCPHQTIVEFLKEINFYTDLRAKELYMSGIPVYWTSIVLYPIGKLIYNYFFKLGFLDGTAGLIFALMMSFHSSLVRGKLWLLWQKK